jgi:CRISPR-associated protein Cmr1
MRTIPKKSPDGKIEPFLSKDENNRTISKASKGNVTLHIERKYELITPLFGGGVEAGKNDNITLINGKAIRGHLRFWWRATRGGQFGGGAEGLKKMREREAAIWGAASMLNKPSPSQVQIEVYDVSKKDIEYPYRAKSKPNEGWQWLVYAAFPLQETPENSVSTGVKFTLKISFPERMKDGNELDALLSNEIEAALWAWETFGGIGARTRRGFGALRTSESLSANPEKIQDWIKQRLEKYVVNAEFPPNVPHLSLDMSFAIASHKKNVQVGKDKIFKSIAYESPDYAWEVLISELKNFRQARNRGTYGRSKWNEPEQVRRITKQRSSKHDPLIDLFSIERFPRGEFGLPILFHFKDEDDGDPHDMTLKGELVGENKYRERLASPLILRPLACGGNKGVGLTAILKTPHKPPGGLVLKGNGIEEKVEMKLTKKDALKIEPLKAFASKLENDDDEVDVLEAFIDRFRTEEKTK